MNKNSDETEVFKNEEKEIKDELNKKLDAENDADKITEIEEIISEDVKLKLHEDSKSLKEEGNTFFSKGEYEPAIDLYSQGIAKCPKCFSKTLSILYSNRSACYMKLDETELAINDCSSALEHDHYYTKARLRRAQIYETKDKLEEALKDYNEILSYDKSCQIAGSAAMRLPGQINERNEKLKEEMFSKLKDLGNMCLKPFGLSTNNFKVNQDPKTGGYSINFQK
ncbi:tetratricopeptide repeat protein 1-like [Hydra vulgaris]|uniref:Tetratricopeptide repeat protein 1-like n=1 Tax=Hydra vulgaris TaxID=6087 RepID=A0ABM4BJU4_HYDVU